jgi:hypothetical protein
MPDFAMWGPEQSGFRLAEQDSIRNFTNIAAGQHQQALAQEAQQRVAQQKKQMEIMGKLTTPDGKGGPGAGGDLADVPESVGRQLIQAGQLEAGTKMLEHASTIRFKQAEAVHQTASAEAQKAITQIKMFDRARQLVGAATDARSFDVANMMFAQEFPQAKNPFAGMAYSPELVKSITEKALTAKEAAELKIKQAREQSLEVKDRAQVGHLAVQSEVARGRLEETRRYHDARIKNSGTVNDLAERKFEAKREPSEKAPKPLGTPKAEEVVAAGQTMQRYAPEGASAADLKTASYQVAEETKKIMRDIPALSAPQARERAAREVAKGFWKSRGMFGDTVKFGGGETPQNAIPLPKTAREAVVGKHYFNSKGAVMVWDGKALQAPGTAVGKKAAGRAAPEDGEDNPEGGY